MMAERYATKKECVHTLAAYTSDKFRMTLLIRHTVYPRITKKLENLYSMRIKGDSPFRGTLDDYGNGGACNR